MGQLKKMVMAVQYDDQVDLSLIPEMELVDRIINEGYDLDEVAPPEGFSGECND
jgi:hypothetical protein